MELRQLKYFVAVAESKSFSHAAQKLFVTQPTITASIKQLEGELELTLIKRNMRTTALTEAGELLYHDAKEILSQVNETVLRLDTLKRKQEKIITIGVAVRSCRKLLPLFFENNMPLQSDYQIKFKEMISPDIYEAVTNGTLDYGLCIPPREITPHVAVKTLFTGHIRVLMSADHPLAGGKGPISLEAISGETIFVFTNGSEKRGMIEVIFSELFQKKGLKHNKIVPMADSYTLMCMVAVGVGVCLMPDTSSEYMLVMPNTVLKDIELDDRSDAFSIALLYLKKTSDAEVTRALIRTFENFLGR